MTPHQIDQLVPGGILSTDHVHRGTNDNTCSRCGEDVRDDEVPLLLWSQDGHNLLIYCERCLGIERMPDFEDGP